MNINNLQTGQSKKKRGYIHNNYILYPGAPHTSVITFYSCREMIIGIHLDEKGKYWNGKMEVLLEAIHKGRWYILGIEKYKSERSLLLKINKFVKYIVSQPLPPNH